MHLHYPAHQRTQHGSRHDTICDVYAPGQPKSEDELLPGLANVDDIDTVSSGLPEVRFHVNLQVLGSKVRLRGEEHLDVLGRRVHGGGEVCGRHLESN